MKIALFGTDLDPFWPASQDDVITAKVVQHTGGWPSPMHWTGPRPVTARGRMYCPFDGAAVVPGRFTGHHAYGTACLITSCRLCDSELEIPLC